MHKRRVVIQGRVQGVYYRAWAVTRAQELGIKGWVRNRGDGTVEALFAGDEETVAAMINACRQGPPAALVNKIDIHASEEAIEGDDFVKLPTL